jgi:uncharacterized membrane protein
MDLQVCGGVEPLHLIGSVLAIWVALQVFYLALLEMYCHSW